MALVRPGQKAWMPVGGRVAVPGVGHCSSSLEEDRWSKTRVKVLCESPSGLPSVVRVTVWTREDGPTFPGWLGNYGNAAPGPQMAWLSPLDRGKTFFNLSDPQDRYYAIPTEVPEEHIANARIAVTPEVVTGYSVVRFDLPDVPLSKYWIEPVRPGNQTYRFRAR